MNYKKRIILNILQIISDKIFNSLLFKIKIGFFPNFKKPRSYNEKINHIKLYSKNKLRKLVADRMRVRDYVKNNAPECDLINILWSGDTFNEDVYKELPRQFVIKANHGSGMVMIVTKEQHSFVEILHETEKWKNVDYGKLTRQFVYKDVPKTIIVEEFINFNSEVLPDYKFHCISGRIEFVQIDSDRFKKHTRNLYNKDFKKLNTTLEYPPGNEIKKPLLFEKAKIISEKLSKDFDFIRVDLYILDDKIYFGELTNTPGNGFEKFNPLSFDLELGRKIIFKKEFE